ncbi:MAG TPA: hypothetical protein VMR59_00080 [Patescibacteria group bacterium]|jgi:hypothetical protein|nr:hypothetical protein [Patescibacteria group bacterium]
MHRKQRPIWLIAISLLLIATLGYLIFNFSPNDQFSISHTPFPILPIFLLLSFLLLFSLTTFILNNSRRGFLLGLLVISYLLLRLNGLTSPFFAILLLILFAGIELFFVKRK